LTTTRPDISFIAGVVSQCMTAPSIAHWKAAERILRYVKGTLGFRLLFTTCDDFNLKATQTQIGLTTLMTRSLHQDMHSLLVLA